MSQTLTHRVEVFVSVPVSDDPQHADYPTLEVARSREFRRTLEATMLAALRRLEYDVTNIEAMDYTVEDDE